jgi:hypothetical protein
VQAVQQPRRLVEAVVEAAEGVVRQPEQHSPAQMERIKRRISQTTPQPPRSVLAEQAADER